MVIEHGHDLVDVADDEHVVRVAVRDHHELGLLPGVGDFPAKTANKTSSMRTLVYGTLRPEMI